MCKSRKAQIRAFLERGANSALYRKQKVPKSCQNDPGRKKIFHVRCWCFSPSASAEHKTNNSAFRNVNPAHTKLSVAQA